MGKDRGGTRNYSNQPKTLASREAEYRSLLATGNFDEGKSYFDKSGGYVVTHKDHAEISHEGGDYSDVAAKSLAKKGYKIVLSSERTTISDMQRRNDGTIYDKKAEFKTINRAGKYTIKNAIEKASRQGAEVVVIVQKTKSLTREYMEEQFRSFVEKSPKKAVNKVKWVITVGMSGDVHRRKVKK